MNFHSVQLNHRLTTFQRTYVREVRRCSEIERCLRYLEHEVVEGGVSDHIPPLDTSRTDITLLREMYDLEVKTICDFMLMAFLVLKM